MTSPPPPQDIRQGRNRLAAIIVVGHGIKHVYNSGLNSLLLPEIKIDLGLNGSQFGALISVRQVTAWATTLGAGYLGDRFINRAPLMLGFSLGLLGVAFLLAGYASSFWTMLLVMLLIGIGPSLFHPPALGVLSRRFPDRRGFAISLHGTGGIAGEVVGPLVVGGVLTLMTWQGLMQASLFPALIAGILIWATMRAVPSKELVTSSAQGYLFSLVSLLKNRVILFLVLATALRSMSDAAVGSFLPVYLREDLEFSKMQVAVYLSLAQVAGLGAQPAMGYISDRVGRKAVLVPCMAANGLLAIALAFANSGVQLALTVVARGAFIFSLHHILVATATDYAPGRLQSTVVSLIYGAGFLGTFSPYLAGLIADKFQIHSVFIYGGSAALLGAVVLSSLELRKDDQRLTAPARG